jgi:hypothetical protein
MRGISENTQKCSDISGKAANRRGALQQQSFLVKRARSSTQKVKIHQVGERNHHPIQFGSCLLMSH